MAALGYYLLTGEHVFTAESILDLYDKHLTAAPVAPSKRSANPITPELEETILRCLEKEPNLRPQSVAELRALLLTSPRAFEWKPEARLGWWAQYQIHALEEDAAAQHPLGGQIEATVKIDISSRLSRQFKDGE